MAYYALIGGRSPEYLIDFSLEEKIFQRLGLKNPKILFFPFACKKDREQSIIKFKRLTQETGYQISFLRDLTDRSVVLKSIRKADVLYFGGGSAEELVHTVKESCLLEILKETANTNKLLMGISAGAILLARSGMGDQHSYKNRDSIYNYQMVEGIGLVNLTVCPHYDHLGLWCYNDAVKEYEVDGIALEDDTAILIGETMEVFKIDKTKSVYYFSFKDDYLMQPLYEVEG